MEKFMQPPRLPARLAPRNSLEARLDSLAPATFVRGLPGTGKSTLVGHWGRTFDDSDTVVFWPHSKEQLKEILDTTFHQKTIIIADFPNPTFSLNVLTEHPDLYIITVSTNRLPTEVQAKKDGLPLTVLTTNDMLLSCEELAFCAKAWGFDLDSETNSRLHQMSGGWLTPARMALESREPIARSFNYQAATSFAAQALDEPTKSIASSLAFTSVIDAQLASAILQTDDSYPTLSRLEELGVLRRLSKVFQKKEEWEMLPLLRRALRDQQVLSSPEQTKMIRQRIAQVLVNQPERISDSIVNASAAQEWALLDRLWTEHGMTLADQFNSQFVSAFSSIPSEVLREYPNLVIPYTLTESIIFTEEIEKSGTSLSLSRFENLAHRVGLQQLSGSFSNERAIEAAIRILAERNAGHHNNAIRIAENFYNDFQSAPLEQRNTVKGDSLAWVDMEWGTTAIETDMGVNGYRTLQRAYSRAVEAGSIVIASRCAGQMGLLSALDGCTTDVNTWLRLHRHHSSKTSWKDETLIQPALAARALLAIDRLDSATAEETVAEFGPFSQWRHLWHSRAFVWVRTQLYFGDARSALRQLYTLVISKLGQVPIGPWTQVLLDRILVETLLASGQLNRAQVILDKADEAAHHFDIPKARFSLMTGDYRMVRSSTMAHEADLRISRRDRIEFSLLGAVAALEMGDTDEAINLFMRGHEQIQEMKLWSSYLLIPSVARERLLELTQTQFEDTLRERLANCQDVYPESAPLVVLSSREQVVLSQLDKTENTAAIAESLVVSVHTVKNQLASIYSKLGVHERKSALFEARRLGLLAPIDPLDDSENALQL